MLNSLHSSIKSKASPETTLSAFSPTTAASTPFTITQNPVSWSDDAFANCKCGVLYDTIYCRYIIFMYNTKCKQRKAKAEIYNGRLFPSITFI
jgi:hypothetical protein